MLSYDFNMFSKKDIYIRFEDNDVIISYKAMQQKVLVLIIGILSLTMGQVPKLPLFVGRGYDLLRGNPLSSVVDGGFEHDIFNFTYANKVTTSDGRYLVPDGVSHVKASSCSFTSDVSTYRGTKSYQDQLKTKAVVSGGYNSRLWDAAFSVSNNFKSMEKYTSEQNYSLTQATAECEAYRLSINIFLYESLLGNFVEGVVQSSKSGNWTKFIDQFGTHYVYTTSLGGRATQEISYTYESVSKMTAVGIDIGLAAKASFAKTYGDTSFDFSKHTEQINYSEKYSQSVKEIYVGGQPPKDGNVRIWAESVINSPMPLIYDLYILSDLFKVINRTGFDAKKAQQQFNQALDNYCTSINCKKALADKDSPFPAVVSEAKTLAQGGEGGVFFQWKARYPVTMNIKKLIIYYGAYIDSLQMEMSDGVKSEYSPKQGGTDGGRYEWEVPADQYVTQIEVRSDAYIDSLTFITNKGVRSEKKGGNGGKYKLITLPDGYRIVGFFGRSSKYLDKIGFIIANTIYPSTAATTVVESVSNAIGAPGTSADADFTGSYFEWKSPSNTVSPVKFVFRSAKYIDNIKIEFTNGISSPSFGGTGGSVREWVVPSGEYVSKVEYRYEDTIDKLTFITNSGQRSPTFGEGTGKQYYLEIFPNDYRIIGLFGNKGKLINQLGFYLAKTISQSSQKHTLIRRHLLKH